MLTSKDNNHFLKGEEDLIYVFYITMQSSITKAYK